MTRPGAIVLGLAIGLGCAGPAATAPIPMSEDELSRERAGLLTPIGVEIGFGATMRTYVDGSLVLETRLTWTDQGPVKVVLGDVTATGLPPSAASTLTIPAVAGGATQIIQDLSGARIASVILNTASDRHIRQDTDVTLFLPQLPQLQGAFGAEQISLRLRSALGLALQGSARAGH